MLWYLKQSSLRWLVLLGQNFQISIFDCYSVVLEQCHLASRWCLHLYHRNQWKLNTLSDLSKRKISHQKLPPKAWLRKFIQKSCSVGTALLLVILDQLVEAQQDAQPATTVIRLQVKADLVHNSCPSNRVVMLDHVVNTSCELHSIKVRRKDYKWKWSFIPAPCVHVPLCYLRRSGDWMMASTMWSRMNCLSSSGMLLVGPSVLALSPSLQCCVTMFFR